MKYIYSTLMILAVLFTAACGGGSNSEQNSDQSAPTDEVVEDDPLQNKGIGPITSVTLGEIDTAMANAGQASFKTKCKTCHRVDKRFVGPAIQGVLERRSPEWVMNMMLNPEVMVEEDPIAIELLAEYLSPMANQNLSQEEARSILEYFRTL